MRPPDLIGPFLMPAYAEVPNCFKFYIFFLFREGVIPASSTILWDIKDEACLIVV